MANPYVVVIGNVCTGKTTFVNGFAALHENWRSLPENLAEIPGKSSNDDDLTFHLATYFMVYYANHHLQARNTYGPLIQENCLEISSLFPEAYYELDRFSLNEFNTLKMGYSVFLRTLPQPDFYLYLHAPLEILMARAEAREEPLRTISRNLIPLMQNKIEAWIQNSIDPNSFLQLDTSSANTFEGNNIFYATLAHLRAKKVFPF